MKTTFNAALSFLVMLLVGLSITSAYAQIFRPAGLNPGDQYQLAFVTQGTTDALSSDIETYNEFVNQQAAMSSGLTGTALGLTGNALGVNWSAIASTATAHARDNALVEAPVYLFNSSSIASGFNDMWDGQLANSLSLNQFGDSATPAVWTGSNTAGFSSGSPLGGSSSVFGFAASQDGGWIVIEDDSSALDFSLYALSETITVRSGVKAKFNLNIVFTNPPTEWAPGTFGLEDAPEEVEASFLLGEGTTRNDGGTSYVVSDLLSADVPLGDANFSSVAAFDLELGADGSIESLGWRFNELSTTSVSNGLITMNSPLGISGTNIATGDAFSYSYGISSATITSAPEPSTLMIGLGLVLAGAFRRNRQG